MSGGNWYKVLDILKLNEDELRLWKTTPPIACPNDGAVLAAGDAGVLHCPMGDYEYPRDGHPADRRGF